MTDLGNMQSVESYDLNGHEVVENVKDNHFTHDKTRIALKLKDFLNVYDKLRKENYNHSNAWRASLRSVPLSLEQQSLVMQFIKSKEKDFYINTSSKKRTIVSSEVSSLL